MSFFYLVFNSIFLAFTIHTEIPFSNVEKAFASADATGITAIGKERMMLNILGKEAVYSQSQATMILNDFFSRKPVSGFKFIYKGKENADGSYAIGVYESKNENFRVTVQFKKINNDYKIESLSIQK